MSQQPQKVFRATDPAAVRAAIDQWKAAYNAFFDRVREFERGQLGGIELIVVGDGDRTFANHLGTKLHGEPVEGMPIWTPNGLFRQFGERDLVAEIPSGWHFYKKDREVRPYAGGRDANSKAAKKALAELNETSPGGPRRPIRREFGVDLHGFGFEEVGDDFFVLKGSSWITTNWSGNEHFEQVPMSTYWVVKEQAAEAEAEAEEAGAA